MKTKDELPDDLRAELDALEARGYGHPTHDMPETDFSGPNAVRGKYVNYDNRPSPWLVDKPPGKVA